ncbi:MAG: fold metallo-hydrolase [Moraxellaceae bacterium]|jgi:L-ascorbate metabolism protein UlaG (beta-lactamase superfamily)|nr:fold metallo-hydrolase [Moraxellaceae bacterium]
MPAWKRLLGLQQPREEWFTAPDPAIAGSGATLELTYLGTAGFILKGQGRTVVLDPYVTRPGLRETFTAALVPDTALIRATIPHADDVLVGHAHYDHILDAPDLCKQTGARLIGSSSTILVGRAAGLPEAQLVETAGREDIASGPWTVRGLPSRHGLVFGRIPFPGHITAVPSWPPRVRELKHGLVLNWIVDTGTLRVAHIDSADVINEELAGQQADVVCLCAIGRKYRPNYVKDVVRLLQPKWIVPCHWDTMLTPLHAKPDLIPTVDLPGLLAEIRAEGVEPLLTPILGKRHFPDCRHGKAGL